MRRLLLVLLALAASAAAPAAAANAPVRPVPAVDLACDAGSWSQLAATTVFSNDDCRRDTTAASTAQPRRDHPGRQPLHG